MNDWLLSVLQNRNLWLIGVGELHFPITLGEVVQTDVMLQVESNRRGIRAYISELSHGASSQTLVEKKSWESEGVAPFWSFPRLLTSVHLRKKAAIMNDVPNTAAFRSASFGRLNISGNPFKAISVLRKRAYIGYPHENWLF